MRILAIFTGAFSAGIFLAQSLLPVDCLPFCAAAALVLSLSRLFLRPDAGRRALLMGTALALAFGYDWLYVRQVSAPMEALSGTEAEVVFTLTGQAVPTAYGARATVTAEGFPGKLAYYGGRELLDLRPGDCVRDRVRFQSARMIREDEITAFTSQGVFLLAYGRGEAVTEPGEPSLRYWPAVAGHAVREKIDEIFPAETAPFLAAILTGDRSGLSTADSAVLEEAGLSHLLAVSGMHCGFLLALMSFLIGRHRRKLLAACAIPLLIFYALLTGARPSVVRACVMLFFLLLAPLFGRESDGPTSLAAALCLILIQNPFAAASVSLQLSFASVAGLLWLSSPLYRALAGNGEIADDGTAMSFGKSGACTEKRTAAGRKKRRGFRERFLWMVRAFLAAGVSASVGALAFTAPLTGYYFGVLPLIAPVSNLLCLWAAGGIFVTGLAAAAVGFLIPPLGTIAALAADLLVRYVLAVSRLLAGLPGHAAYFANPYLKYWLVYALLLLAAARFWGRPTVRKSLMAAGLAVLSLAFTVWLGQTRYQSALDVVMLDVGQGQCVAAKSDSRFVLVDCGSGNSWYDAGALAARQLRCMGCRRLDTLVLTHFDSDHVNGTEALLARIPVAELLIPDAAEDTATREAILSLAERYGVAVRSPAEREVLPMGKGTCTVFPPVGTASSDNERGLSVLLSTEEADILVTGDMGQSTEKKLLAAYALPDLEALAAGHHGSRTATSDALLDALTPETVCISVGSNSYGHPSPETLARLESHGCTVYRTDRDGDIHLALDGETDE